MTSRPIDNMPDARTDTSTLPPPEHPDPDPDLRGHDPTGDTDHTELTEPAIDGAPPHPPGHEIAPGYRVLAHMRRGKDCDLYDAWSERRFSRCVLKTLTPDHSGSRFARRHLLAEGRLLLSLTHPHIARGYELLRPPPPAPPVLVSETLPGATLAYLIEDLQLRLPDDALGHLGRHLCSALRYLHAQGYLHLDIKPSNIISAGGRAQLIDLGLARRPGPCPRGPGTPAYMAPEQVRGGTLTPAADVWGIGLVLYHAATGHQPFDQPGHTRSARARTITAELAEHYPQLTHRPPHLRARRRLPRPAADVIDACLYPDPTQRPTLEQLDTALTTLTSDPETPTPT